MVATVLVSADDYLECIGFTTYAYLTNKIVKRDLMKGSERALGEFLEHFIRGKLAEYAFKTYIENIAKLEALVDVDLPFFIRGKYLPDILALRMNEKWDFARFWIEVKAVTGQQRWMLLPTTSVTGSKRKQPRPYCAYVNCLVDLLQDHVARLIKYAPKIAEKMSPEWKAKLVDVGEIKVTVLGYVLYNDVRNILTSDASSRQSLDEAFGPENWRYLKRQTSFKDIETGKGYGGFGRDNCVVRLTKLRKNWEQFTGLIRSNKPLAPENSRDMGSFQNQMVKAFELLSKHETKSWFKRSLDEPQNGPLPKWFGS